MLGEMQQSLIESASRFPVPDGARFAYGTAGFRANAEILASTVFRAGLLAALRSLKTGAVVGLMITASHNPISDNGVKIADPDGGMLTQRWEPFADTLANVSDPHHLLQLVIEFAKDENILLGGECSGQVMLGRDTRPSGEALLEAAKQGICAIVGVIAVDMGILTTPQLHWMVRNRNKGLKATESDYYLQLSTSFRCLVDLAPLENRTKSSFDAKVVVDAANGVGGEKLIELQKMLTMSEIQVRNAGKGEGVLNEGCGADFVQKEKVPPSGFGLDDIGLRCASFDGDADRLVYFCLTSTSGKNINLIDGDKILSLFAIFVKEQLNFLNKDASTLPVRLGIVQTAYANGASTNYLKQLGLDVVFTPTGVKYLHKKASEYDIGIYFEANGHGTVLFSEDIIFTLEAKKNELSSSAAGSEQHKAAVRLLSVSQLINQAVGDAISGLLLVEAVLYHLRWSAQTWSNLYHDLPSRQLKVTVADRTLVVTANAETQVVKPEGLQELIDGEIAKYENGRCFIRPSGTEDIIRVYAEASTQQEADCLAQAVAKHVERVLGFH